MTAKTAPHQYYFEVQLNWQQGHKGIITANDVKDTVKVATPAKFPGGEPDMWSPEHLFLGALCSSFMTTCLAIAEKKQLTITHFTCNAIGHVAVTGSHMQFVTADLYPEVFVPGSQYVTLANEVVLKTYQHSIIANSIKTKIINHARVIVEKEYHKKM